MEPPGPFRRGCRSLVRALYDSGHGLRSTGPRPAPRATACCCPSAAAGLRGPRPPASRRGAAIRNGADVLLKSLFVLLGGRHGLTVFAVLLLGTGLVLVVRDWRRSGAPRAGISSACWASRCVYAALLRAVITSVLTGAAAHGPAGARHRAGRRRSGCRPSSWSRSGRGSTRNCCSGWSLVSALAKLATAGFGWRPGLAGGSSRPCWAPFIFSAFHYIGPLGDTLEVGSFVFRMVAGVLLSGLFLLRGFGIAAWTHALYDVFLTLAGCDERSGRRRRVPVDSIATCRSSPAKANRGPAGTPPAGPRRRSRPTPSI